MKQDSTGDFDRKATLQALCRKMGARLASEVDTERTEAFRSGVGCVDELPSGGFPRNTVSEVMEPNPSSGGTFLLHQLLNQVRVQRRYAALVDGGDCFAPDSMPLETLRHLYWVRCRGTDEALRVADLLAGDSNFSLLLIDLRSSDASALRRVPGNRWYRLQRAVRKAACTCVALTAEPLIPSATLRLRLVGRFDLSALEQTQALLAGQVSVEPLHAGHAGRIERFG